MGKYGELWVFHWVVNTLKTPEVLTFIILVFEIIFILFLKFLKYLNFLKFCIFFSKFPDGTGHERFIQSNVDRTLGGANDDERIGWSTKGNTFEHNWSSSRFCCKFFCPPLLKIRTRWSRMFLDSDVPGLGLLWRGQSWYFKLLILARHKKQNNAEMDFYCTGICSCNDPCWSLVESKF